MTAREKAMIITKITEWLERELHADDTPPAPAATETNNPPELLTLKECRELVKGLSEHTVRQLAIQGSFRAFAPARSRAAKFLYTRMPCLTTFRGKSAKARK